MITSLASSSFNRNIFFKEWVMFKFSNICILLVSLLTLTITVSTYAGNKKLRPTKSTIMNLEKTLEEATAKAKFNKSFSDEVIPNDQFIAFPNHVPAHKDKLYASYQHYQDGSDVIEIAIDEKCSGEKPCTKGTLSMKWTENPTIYYDRSNQLETYPVKLHCGIQGYYTKGFAMADFWPANIQWRDREVLYKLWWNNSTKKDLIQMANSEIDQLHAKYCGKS